MSEEKYRFDLSDGFGKEDIFAIFTSIWRAIAFVLKVILFPYVWILRMLSRSVRFIKSKKAGDKPLTEDEKRFMESLPTFFILVGFFIGLLYAVFIVVFGTDALDSFFSNLQLDQPLEIIQWWLLLFIEIILWIIGLDTYFTLNESITNTFHQVEGTKVFRFGLVDVIRVSFEFIAELFTSDPLLLFFGIGIVGVVIAIVWIVISETGIVSGLISLVVRIYRLFRDTPGKAYNKVFNMYLGFNKRLSSFVIGTNRIENNHRSFHKKITVYSLGLGIWTFLGGIFVYASQDLGGDVTLQIFFIMIVLIVFGLGVGIVEMLLIVQFLDRISGGKYKETT